MKPTDVVVQVRDKTLGIVDSIDWSNENETAKFQLHKLYANVGTWSLVVPVEHPLKNALDAPGAGVVVQLNGKVIASGRVTTPISTQSYADPQGMIEFQGVTDNIIIQDALAYPDPANTPMNQSKVSDKRTGPCETLMHEYVSWNIGPNALPDRKRSNLVMGNNGARGKTVTRKPRFKGLGGLVAGLARVGKLGFEVIQSGSSLEFRTYAVQDKTATVILDVAADDVESVQVAQSGPTPTDVVVGGRGHGKKRMFKNVSTTASQQVSTDWDRRIEVYMDYRGADETPEATDLTDAGQTYLDDETVPPFNVQITPSEYAEKQYGTAWELGDKITVKRLGKDLHVTATGLIIRVDENGARYGVTFGDPVMNDAGTGAGAGYNVGGTPKPNPSPKGGSHVGDDFGGRLADLESYVPDLTETTLDGLDYAVDHRVLLLEHGQTVQQWCEANNYPIELIQVGTIIFEKV